MKKCIIMRGLPGSGKSTLAKQIFDQADDKGLTAVICAADDFCMVDGKYVFENSKAGHYHLANQAKAKEHIEAGYDLVIIDNTNITASEASPYVGFALEQDYAVYLIEPNTDWMFNEDDSWNIDALIEKGTHGVPREVYEKMISSWQNIDDMGEKLAEKFNCTYDVVARVLFRELE